MLAFFLLLPLLLLFMNRLPTPHLSLGIVVCLSQPWTLVLQNFWTVPEVVAEIRDKKARHHLESLPFELKLREPSDEAMKFGETKAGWVVTDLAWITSAGCARILVLNASLVLGCFRRISVSALRCGTSIPALGRVGGTS